MFEKKKIWSDFTKVGCDIIRHWKDHFKSDFKIRSRSSSQKGSNQDQRSFLASKVDFMCGYEKSHKNKEQEQYKILKNLK
jgi:hypothetical protein